MDANPSGESTKPSNNLNAITDNKVDREKLKKEA